VPLLRETPRTLSLDALCGGERLAVRVADEDPALLGSLRGELAEAARHQLLARTIWRDPGRWEPLNADVPSDFDGWLGMLVLDGLLVRQLDIDGLRCCELLGPGDVLRPWDEEDAAATLDTGAMWRVLEPTRLALLDAGFARRASRWPTLTSELMQRTIRRSRSLSVLLAITQARRADVRLRALFVHLADRWGRVTPDGVILPLRLTHSVIAQLTGLRRPSVSLSLGELERTGEIVRLSKSAWLIARQAPAARAA
jgi:CRP-like cAMP-binding protein